MINKIPKSILAIFLTILFLALLSFSISAVDATTGYTVDADGNLTNIKYTMTEDGTLSFEIDKESSNASSTVIVNRDPITGTKANYKTCNPTYEKAVKIIIGEGITEISGFAKLTQLTSVEIPTSLKTIEKYAFEVDTALTSIYLKGTTPLQGTFDLSHIEKIGTYTFDSCPKLTKVILNPSYCYEFGTECFKNTAITEIEIPSGTTVVKAKAFTSTKKLHTFTVLGMETVLESDDIFKGNTLYPAIKAKSGSKAAEFAIKNGYTFIDLDSGEIVQGTKATAAIHSGSSEGDTSIKNRIDTDKVYSPAVTDFNPQGATVWGHSSGQYNGKDIINTWWAYYGDTKTLEFVSATTNYNETGSLSNVDKQYESWDAYKNEIEHIIIGDNIRKVSMSIFSGYTNLKDVKIGRNVVKIDTNAFFDCPNLTTLWREGTERVEGRIDLTGLVELSKIFRDNSFTELVIPESVKEIKIDIPQSVKAIYTYQVNDKLIEYAKTNLFNLINMNNPSESYNYWIEIDNTLPSCGPRCVYGFDEATGTLTVYGSGAISDIINYYGGGSKMQPWFSIKKQVKHIVLSEHITAIGKYAFCEFVNLETVQIPDTENFSILNGAFEKCHNLKSVYRAGTEPIEGTFDLRKINELIAFSFAYDYLVANVIVSPNVSKIGSSVFEENIGLNLKNIYGTPGSYAESYANENGLSFFDINITSPSHITCTPPESEAVTEKENAAKAEETTSGEKAEADDTESKAEESESPEKPAVKYIDEEEYNAIVKANVIRIIVISFVVILAITIVAVLLIRKKKQNK